MPTLSWVLLAPRRESGAHWPTEGKSEEGTKLYSCVPHVARKFASTPHFLARINVTSHHDIFQPLIPEFAFFHPGNGYFAMVKCIQVTILTSFDFPEALHPANKHHTDHRIC
jgi:hypothetical protein